MSNKNFNNIAYIDAANLHKGIKSLGWNIDYKRLRVWLLEKYSVKKAYIFIGLIPKYKDLYSNFQESGYNLIYKEVIYDGDGKAKGNCDADLVLKVVQDYYENKYDNAIIITSDGDYAGLIKFLIDKNKLLVVLSPSSIKKCSVLLKRTNAKIAYLNDQKSILEFSKKEKTPDKDRTL